jgi:hypothetical protein
MPRKYLHNHPQFADLVRMVAQEKGIDPALVEKDYWIMHCLYGLQQLGLTFELKGGTSLSKGFQIIDRFSEDIDIRIEPPEGQDVKTGRNHLKDAHRKSRKDFYGWLARTIKIDGVTKVERDTAFDNKDLFSAGIRLHYKSIAEPNEDLRAGVLLEAGFANVTPNVPKDISSWAYDYAADKVDIIDNRAKAVACYDPGYTLVEKLQTISTKFRRQQETGELPSDFMRHYYDIYRLFGRPEVQAFIGTDAYQEHKRNHFPKVDNQNIAENEAFLLSDAKTRATYETAYARGSALYYKGRPTFQEILTRSKP